MKRAVLIFLLFLSLGVYAQGSFYGRYLDELGSEITLNPDSTFAYSHHFDLIGTWTVGTYRVVNDTIFFKEVPVFDTLEIKNGADQKDSLVLSDDREPKRITMEQFINRPLLSGAQDRFPHPNLLIWRKSRLYAVDQQGKMKTRKARYPPKGKKYKSWYIKSKVE